MHALSKGDSMSNVDSSAQAAVAIEGLRKSYGTNEVLSLIHI